VSLLPGATETLFALGLGGSVVGVTHECDHPAAARALPEAERQGSGEGLPSSTAPATFSRPGPRLIESLEVLVEEAASIMPCG
jgi:hypothetical protein